MAVLNVLLLGNPKLHEVSHPVKRHDVSNLKGLIKDLSSGRTFIAQPFPPFMRDLIAEGGLLAYAAKRGRNKGSGA